MKTAVIAPNLATREGSQRNYPYIQENEAFVNSAAYELNLVFGKFGSNHRSKIAQLLNAEHFVVLIFSAQHDNVKDAENIDLFHLYPKRGLNRILVEPISPDEVKNADDLTLYQTRTIYKKSYSELIEFCKAKDDQRATYYRMADNCHKFCIDFAEFCEIDCSDMALTEIARFLYGLINFMKFCAFCVANHHYRVYLYTMMFLLWSIFSTAWWTQIHSFKNSMKSPFDSCATGTFFILFGSLFAVMLRFQCPDVYKNYRNDGCDKCKVYFLAILFIVGGICYWFGGFAVTGSIRHNCNANYCSAFAGVWFIECSLIGVNAVIFGMDIVFKVLDFHLFRKFFNLGLLAFISLVGFFCYAILSTHLSSDIQQDEGYTTLGAVAAAYFFIFCIASFYICWNIYKYYVVNVDEDHDWGMRIVLDLGCLTCFLFFGFMLLCGYWAMTSYDNQSIEKSALHATTDLNKTYLTVYWVGMSFFWTFFLFIIISDMHIGTPDSVNIKGAFEEVPDDDDGEESE